MIKDIHLRKKRGRHRFVNADSAASDKRRPFLTANAEEEEEEPRAEEATLS